MDQQRNQPKSGTIGGIDLIRLIAASMVMIYHFLYIGPRLENPHVPEADYFSKWSPFCYFGWVGVEIFFVISGIVIYKSAERSNFSNFVKGRLLRLLPAVWICAPISVCISFFFGDVDIPGAAERLLRGILLFPIAPWPASVYWTLGVEISFYSVVSFYLLVGRLNHLRATIYTLSIMSTIFWTAFFIFQDLSDIFVHLRSSRLFELALLQHAPFFATGVALQILSSQSRFRLVDAVSLGVSIVGGSLEIWAVNDEISSLIGDRRGALLPIIVWLIAVLCMAYSLICMEKSTSSRAKIMRYLGLVTYPLYLVHEKLGVAVGYISNELSSSPLVAFLAKTVSCFAVAMIVARWLEPWLRKRLALFVEGILRRIG